MSNIFRISITIENRKIRHFPTINQNLIILIKHKKIEIKIKKNFKCKLILKSLYNV